jgi:hypothetical protein
MLPDGCIVHSGSEYNPMGASKYLYGDTCKHNQERKYLYLPLKGFRPIWSSPGFWGGEKTRLHMLVVEIANS